MPTGNPAPELDWEALAVEITEFLDQFADHMEVAEGAAAKLNRLLLGLLKAEVLPQATRAAELGIDPLGIDPMPIFAVVTRVLRMYADALERPDAL